MPELAAFVISQFAEEIDRILGIHIDANIGLSIYRSKIAELIKNAPAGAEYSLVTGPQITWKLAFSM